jgi:adenylosuccinate lyase
MIQRYSLPEFADAWSIENKYTTWLAVELAACQAMEKFSVVPTGTAEKLHEAESVISIERIDEIELDVKHDVIAFLTHIGELVGEPSSRWIHYGMTSSDLVDTATAVILSKVNDLIHGKLVRVYNSFLAQIEKHRYTSMIGRSHGMHAEPITFGLMLSGHLAEFNRAHRRFIVASDNMNFGKLSGAVGTYAHLSPSIEKCAMETLKLKPELVSTQVIPRDRYAEYIMSLALIASAVERLATNLRHMQRSEVAEVQEEFSSNQKGSSAMPHKRNPIVCENLCGLARIIRGMVVPAIENISLWHERDISHSSVERMILPDSTSIIGYMLEKTSKLLDGLNINIESMTDNLNRNSDVHCSENVMLALVRNGMSREDAYSAVKKHIEKWGSIYEFDKLSAGDLGKCFNSDYSLRHIDSIIDSVVGLTRR